MPAEFVAPLAQPVGPAGPRADRGGVVEQPGPLLLPGQPLELRPSWVVGEQECLLAVQDRRVRARRIIGALDLAGAEIELDASDERRVRVGDEVGIDEVGDLAGLAVELDQVGAFDLAQVGAGAALVGAEERAQGLQGTAVDVQGIREELADGGAAAGVVDGFGVAGPEQPVVGPPAAVRVAAEERSDVPLQTDREGRHRRPAAEPSEGQVDQQVLGAPSGDRLPFLRPGHALDQGECRFQRAEPGGDRGGLRELRSPPCANALIDLAGTGAKAYDRGWDSAPRRGDRP
jgi:hypothetical protein